MIHGTEDLKQYLADQEKERRETKKLVADAELAKREREAIDKAKARIAAAQRREMNEEDA